MTSGGHLGAAGARPLLLPALSLLPLEVTLLAGEPVTFRPPVGPVLRGALFGALRHELNVCVRKELSSCQPCPLVQVCPLSGLLATVDHASTRGADVPRPLVLRPPWPERTRYEPGEEIVFRTTLVGNGDRYLPYVVLAIQSWARTGIGERKVRGPGGPTGRAPASGQSGSRGGVELTRIVAAAPDGEWEIVYAAPDPVVRSPRLRVASTDAARAMSTLANDRLEITLRTPLRLVRDGSLVKAFEPTTFFHRLVERLGSLASYYGTGGPPDWRLVADLAGRVEVVSDETRWVDVFSYSGRLRRATPIGGLVGRVELRGPWQELGPLLWFGQFVHVGKDVTKGNGAYAIAAPGEGAISSGVECAGHG